MNLRTIELPTGIRTVVMKLLVAIEGAESSQELNIAAQRAEGFVLGLEAASALRCDVIEALYIGFEKATCGRRKHLQTSAFQN